MEESGFWSRPDLASVIGSRLYGIASEDSDMDIRGFVIPPLDYVLGFKRFDQYEYANADIVIYSIKKYIDMLINGNSQAIESLFSNDIIELSVFGTEILNNRKLFLSKKYYRNVRGFAYAEARKARCTQLEIASNDSKLENAIHVIGSSLNLKRYQRDVFLRSLEEVSGQEILKEVPNKKIGHNRNEDFENFGYCRKNYCNTIRLLSQGIELFETGSLTFPRSEASLLKQIRQGNISASEIEEVFKELDYKISQSVLVSPLPDAPDMEKISKLYQDIIIRKFEITKKEDIQ